MINILFRKEITTTADDYRQLVFFTEFRQKKLTVPLMLILGLLALTALALGIIGIIPLIAGIAAAAVSAAVIVFFPIKTAKTAKDGIKYGKVSINAKRIFEYDTSGIRIYGGRTGTDINAAWETVFSIHELESCFIIYITFRTAFCVPKSQLTMQETVQLRNYFTKRLQHRFYLHCKR